jgi:hypothetical protein
VNACHCKCRTPAHTGAVELTDSNTACAELPALHLFSPSVGCCWWQMVDAVRTALQVMPEAPQSTTLCYCILEPNKPLKVFNLVRMPAWEQTGVG